MENPRRRLEWGGICFLLLVCVVLSGCVAAKSYAVPNESLLSPEQIQVNEKKSLKGDGEAASVLAFHYLLGCGDETSAIKWFRVSAKADNANSQYNLGLLLCRDAEGGDAYKEGQRWLLASASNGYDSAVSRIAELYLDGHTELASREQLIEWLRLAVKGTEKIRGDVDRMEKQIQHEALAIILDEKPLAREEQKNAYLHALIADGLLMGGSSIYAKGPRDVKEVLKKNLSEEDRSELEREAGNILRGIGVIPSQ